MNFMIVYILEIIIPTDFHIFQRGRVYHQPDMGYLGIVVGILR